jgi:hypothetical protein
MIDRTMPPVAAATPGPWTLEPGWNDARYTLTRSTGYQGERALLLDIDDAHSAYREATDANARLIAAAPALRDALAAVMNDLERMRVPYRNSAHGKAARAALALVEGR